MPQATAAATLAPPGGDLAPSSGSDFAPLLREVKAAGLLGRRTGWYIAGIALNLLALAAVVAAVVLVGDSWWTVALAVPAAIFWARTSFVGHDAGHAQITSDRRISALIGLVHGNLLLGMSRAWWNDKHNRHHANPNHIDKDPDVAVGALVWTRHQAALRQGFTRWLTRHQARLFFPMLLLEGLNLKVSGLRDLRRQTPRERALEAPLLVVHYIMYIGFLLAVLSPGKALVFGLVHHALFGLYLGMAFAPGHKGMEMPDPQGDRWGHLKRQVVTSRNIRGGPATDWALGGLNYQIEHHLFPSMARPHLPLAQPLVRAHCVRLGLPYTETGLIDSYVWALRHMHDVGAPLRSGVEPAASGTR
ncbi:fatty acid desaturase family protein [Streptomyces zagrosensis]|uniref:Fatty acid desaturase n=1 Tax=Streptomyces zagrosensis TaxID=1042984 RepID=A0A7W9V0F9_9ACTN|nr:acyl-CoA desaturase [Streptomyces zagrosensis]MBB5937787.1 fatty acid desaturase [Streptomyces zagrosensis]